MADLQTACITMANPFLRCCMMFYAAITIRSVRLKVNFEKICSESVLSARNMAQEKLSELHKNRK